MRILYCDCFSGISGDMFLAAMIDAGLPVLALEQLFSTVPLAEYQGFDFQHGLKGAVNAGKIDFHLAEQEADHRHYDEIREMIAALPIPESIKQKSLLIFEKIAEAESAIHATPIDDVHFHEVGAADSILDILGAAFALDYFGIEEVYSSPLPMGTGQVMTQHGLLPLPAPATAWLMRAMNAQTRPVQTDKELVTPTGAGILAAFADFAQPAMKIIASGTGAGKAELPWANVMRVFIADADEKDDMKREHCVVLEANVDDMTPEQLGAVLPLLLEQGALDCWFTPIQMKKNRAAVQLSALVHAKEEEKIADLILRHTTTLGVRVHDVHRYKADRKSKVLHTSLGDVRVKEKWLQGTCVSIHPEYDDCVQLAAHFDLPVYAVYQMIMREIKF